MEIRAMSADNQDQVESNPIATNWVQGKSQNELMESQIQDPIIKIVREWKVNSDVKPQWQEISHLSKIHKAYWAQWDRLVVVDGILYRKWINTITNTQSLQYILPHTFRREVLKLLHDDPLAGHMGIKRTGARVRHRFYWVGYQTFVDKYCQRCIECQKRKGPSKGTRASMKTYVVGETMDRVAIDLLGPIPQTYNGNRYLMVITDYFTRYAEAYPIPNIFASTVADKMVTEFICRYGVPTQIHTDQGSQFTSDLFLQLCKLLHIDKTRNSPFHPQSSGLVERLNGTIEDMLSKVVSKNQRDWDTYVPLLMLAYRSAPHETLGESPNNMMFGREVHMPIDLIYGVQSPDGKLSRPEYIDQLTSRMDKVHTVVRDRLVHAAARQKRKYDLTSKNSQYKVGDGVMLRDSKKYKGRSPKFQFKWEGPFTTMDVPIWNHQCEDCGKRFPTSTKLNKHRRHNHGTKIQCRYCPWTCSADDKYRLRQHETSRHTYHQFYPGDTPRHTGSVKSSVERVEKTFPTRSQPTHTYPPSSISPRHSEATIQQITELLDEQMPDFAELLNEPRTPSPMKRLRNDETTPTLSPTLFIPSNILFSKYLEPISPEPFKDNPVMTYSPSDQPFISRPSPSPVPVSLSLPSQSDETPIPSSPIYTPIDLTKSVTPIIVDQTNEEPMDLSMSSKNLLPTTSPEPLPQPSPLPSPVPSSSNVPSPSPVPVLLSLPSQSDETPLDLSKKSDNKILPAEIDCTLPTNQWKKPTEIKVDPSDNNDASLDPRLFFAGAPSSYMKHPLAKTLQEQINLCRKTRASRYQRRLIPIGTSRIMKEERCYLPDGTVLELRDTWTANYTEE
ncbi:uncharacterized protein LOC134722696 [Mytilus trossulus]|uniref:uncharacterized protein LOC134722696 n=1 Tax=Mytilus trossulus TaxID=6551 RepID=UPI003005D62A